MGAGAAAPYIGGMRLAPLRRKLTPTLWLDLAGAISALTLLTVHAVQAYGYPPCELCLRQREVFWAALGVALVARVATLRTPRAAKWGCMALAVIFAASVVTAAYHAGVEWRWWPGPATCTGASHSALRSADIAKIFSGATRVHMIRCDAAAFRVAGLSMAGWNVILSLLLALTSLSAVAARPARWSYAP